MNKLLNMKYYTHFLGFLSQVQRQMGEGYRMAIIRDGGGKIVAVSGFRMFETFCDGKV